VGGLTALFSCDIIYPSKQNRGKKKYMNEIHFKALHTAKVFNEIKPLEMSIMEAANGFLVAAKESPMTEKEFKSIEIQFSRYNALFKRGVMLIEKKSIPQMSESLLIESLEGESLFLYHHPALIHKNEWVLAEFNFDGKGGFRFLDTGEENQDRLFENARKVNADLKLNLTHPTDKGINAWRIDWEEHPEIKGKEGIKIKEYFSEHLCY
jgi:hypothetical protein